MGLLDKHRLERKKYILVKDFINLIAFTKNEWVTDIISYFVINDLEKELTSYDIDFHDRIIDFGHIEKFGFDYNTRSFLDEGTGQFLFEQYITHRNINKVNCDFYYLISDLNSIECVKELSLDFNLQAQANKAVNEWTDKQKVDRIYRESGADFNKPSSHQLAFFKQDEFSVIDAACLLAGVRNSSVMKYQNHPEFTKVYDDYIGYKLMIELALTNNDLSYCHGSIPSIDLQKYLFKSGYVIKGFNDWLTIAPAKPLKDNKQSIDLGVHQKLLITYDVFTPEQIICLIIDYDPMWIKHDRKFLSYWTTIENAIDAGELMPFNEGQQIEAEQVKIWLAQQNYIYQGFNDHIQTDPIEHIRQLTEKLSAEKLKVIELENQLAQVKTQLAEMPADNSKLQPIDWQNMSEHIYPPELHLAMMIWQRIYWDNELKDSHITSHNGKYEVIANKISLNPKSTLGKRVGMVINNAFTKNKQTELAEQLHAISELNMPQKI